MIRKTSRFLAALGILVATTAFLAIVTWLHAVRPDVDPLRRGVSRYAAGEHGYAVSAAFLMLALALVLSASQLGYPADGQRTSVGSNGTWSVASVRTHRRNSSH